MAEYPSARGRGVAAVATHANRQADESIPGPTFPDHEPKTDHTWGMTRHKKFDAGKGVSKGSRRYC